ncbi:tubulin polyglutamylase TTLL5-like [Pelobates fuscus]|uniref:tubulin polyglutamylase TTLL5-like n=1 Tax=Pelobates fuscus TaxID=191477 RepID=UPI002FE4C57F
MDIEQTNSEETPESQEIKDQEKPPCILWTGSLKKTPIVRFRAEALTNDPHLHEVGTKYKMCFKMVDAGSSLVRTILSSHGFQEVHPISRNFNVMWTGPLRSTSVLTNLTKFQRINHFPKSSVLGQKDLLYKNIQNLQLKHRNNRFDFIPPSFVLPDEYNQFSRVISKDQGPWIVKPVSSSQGHGIQLINSLSQITRKDKLLVSRYIQNPLLIDGLKFDIRLYVLVTSYDPLTIYLFKEGITRFATRKYKLTKENMNNRFVHLTNYSVNKKSASFVSCHNPHVEDYGSKWSMSALLNYLKKNGKDTATLMSKIEDVIIKTIISAEGTIALASKSMLAHRKNCFEIYGFDILIDENMKPWMLEVNLSPSLTCDAPLDLKIKANVVADALTITGVECKDPCERQIKGGCTTSESRPCQTRNRSLAERLEIFEGVKDEEERSGGYIRIFPREDTWKRYGSLLTNTSLNQALASHLYPEKPVVRESSTYEPQQQVPAYECQLPPLKQTVRKYQEMTRKVSRVAREVRQKIEKPVLVAGSGRPSNTTEKCHHRRREPSQDLNKQPDDLRPRVLCSHHGSAGSVQVSEDLLKARFESMKQQEEALIKRRSIEVSNIVAGFSSIYKQAFGETKLL